MSNAAQLRQRRRTDALRMFVLACCGLTCAVVAVILRTADITTAWLLPSRRLLRQASLHALPAEVYAEAASGIPPDWLRLVVAVDSDAAAKEVTQAVADVSESLAVKQTEVLSFKNRHGSLDESKEWILSVWCPPKAMMLISSMIGETFYRCAVETPMLLAEGLEFSGEPDFLSAEMGATAADAGIDGKRLLAMLTDLGHEVVLQHLAACAHLDEETPLLSLRTTASGRRALQRWLPLQGIDVLAVRWTPVGGDGDYLSWVASQTVLDSKVS